MDVAPANTHVMTVLLFAAVAAGLSVFGIVPSYRRHPVSNTWAAFAYALASGLMLGAAYILMSAGAARATLADVLGAGMGVAYTYWTHAFSGTHDLKTTPDAAREPNYDIKIILQSALHSASEGVAIGVAMVVSLRLGVFLALSLAVHNIAEAIVLADIMRSQGTARGHAAMTAVITNVPQILLAVVVFAVVPAAPAILPWVMGFAAGAMLYLVMTELLPFAFERASRTPIAFIVSAAAGTVALLRGFLG